MQYPSEYLVVFTSCPTQTCATELARALLTQHLAACVQISAPATSLYHWDGEICEEQEVSLQIKCLASCYDALAQQLQELHPYKVPEIIAVPVTAGLPVYLDWIKEHSQP